MRLIDADKADVNFINTYYSDHCRTDDVQEWLDEQPTIDAMDCNVLRRIIYSETARLYRADEKMIKAMGGYNPSSFLAGYKYAIDCITSKLSLLGEKGKKHER